MNSSDIVDSLPTNISSSPAGQEHHSEPHLQNRQGPQRAGLLPEALQPGRLCGALPEEPADSPQLSLPAAPVPPAADGDLHIGTSVFLSFSKQLKYLAYTIEAKTVGPFFSELVLFSLVKGLC